MRPQTVILGGLVGAALVLTTAVLNAGRLFPQAHQERETMVQASPQPAGSRRPPPQVDPVVHNGVRFEQARSGLPLDAEDTSGWMRATDEASGAEVWLKQIYQRPPVDGSVPAGGPGVIYMKSIEIAGDRLRVTNTLGAAFLVDPATGASEPAS